MNKKNVRYDIFISYRRSDGFATARLIYDRLYQQGYRVSFDMETLRSGDFNTQLYERIENCRDVVVIVSKEALQFREKREQDWMRLEVAHAIKHKKNIIPVFLRDVAVPLKEDLPEDIADLVMKNGVTASEEHFDSTIDKLCQLFLSSRKIKPLKIIGKSVILLSVLLSLTTIGVYSWHQHQERQVYNQYITQIHVYNLISCDYAVVAETANEACKTKNTDKFEIAKKKLKKRLDELDSLEIPPEIIARSKAKNENEVQKMKKEYVKEITRLTNDLESCVKSKNSNGIERAIKVIIIKLKKQQGKLLSEKISWNLIALLNNAPKNVLEKFKKIQAPTLKYLPALSSPNWPEYKNIADKIKQVNDQIKQVNDQIKQANNKIKEAKGTIKQVNEKIKNIPLQIK